MIDYENQLVYLIKDDCEVLQAFPKENKLEEFVEKLNEMVETEYKENLYSIFDFSVLKEKCDLNKSSKDVLKLKNSDGGYVFVEVVAKQISENNYIFFFKEDDLNLREIQEIKNNNLAQKIALENVNNLVWIYDIKNSEFRFVSALANRFKLPCTFTNVPQSLVRKGIVDLESSQIFYQIHQKLRKGEKEVNGIIKVHPVPNDYAWLKINYVNMFNINGEPYEAVGIASNITSKYDRVRDFLLEEEKIQSNDIEIIATSKTNLTQNRVEKVFYEGNESTLKNNFETYDDLLKYGASNFFDSFEKKNYIEQMSRYNLLESWKNGKYILSNEYRRQANGKIMWMSATNVLIEDFQTGELYAFGYIRNIDEAKKRENQIKEKIGMDKVTGIYNKLTFDKLIYAETIDEETTFAYILFDIDNFKAFNDSFGYVKGDSALKQMAEILKHFLPNAMIARVGGDEFCAFVKNAESSKLIETVEQIIESAERHFETLDNYSHLHMSLTAGIVIGKSKITSVTLLNEQSLFAMTKEKIAGNKKIGIHFASEGNFGENKLSLQKSGFTKKSIVNQIEEPLYIVDCLTNELLFVNEACKEKFGIIDNLEYAKKCHSYLNKSSNLCKNCVLQRSEKDLGTNLLEIDFQGINYKVKKREMLWDGRQAVMSILYESPKNNVQNNKIQNEHYVLQCLTKLFAQGSNFDETMQEILQKVLQWFDARVVYVVEVVDSKLKIDKMIAQNPISEKMFEIAKLTIERIAPALCRKIDEKFRNFDVNEFETTNPQEYAMLKGCGISNFACFRLEHSPNRKTYCCLENPKTNLDSLGDLETIFSVFATFKEKERITEENMFLCNHDAVTLLKNRSAFDIVLEKTMKSNTKSKGLLKVAFMNMNGLKKRDGLAVTNETLHRIANKFLKHFDAEQCFRVSVDEIVVISENMQEVEFFEKSQMLEEELVAEFGKFFVSGKVWTDGNVDIDTLEGFAEEKLVAQKQQYLQLRDDVENIMIVDTKQKERLLHAIEKNWIDINLQPIIELKSMKLLGAEVFVRMLHPKFGNVPPAKFLPILENLGLVQIVDFFVFERACIALKMWKENFEQNLMLSINISRLTLFDKDLVSKLISIVNKHQIKASQICLEFKDTGSGIDLVELLGIVLKLKEVGFKIAMDNFGSTNSDLYKIAKVPIDILKIDRKMVQEICEDKGVKQITWDILRTCKRMNVEVVGEGIESFQQMSTLKKMSCEYGQGFFVSEPLSVEDFEHSNFVVPKTTA